MRPEKSELTVSFRVESAAALIFGHLGVSEHLGLHLTHLKPPLLSVHKLAESLQLGFIDLRLEGTALQLFLSPNFLVIFLLLFLDGFLQQTALIDGIRPRGVVKTFFGLAFLWQSAAHMVLILVITEIIALFRLIKIILLWGVLQTFFGFSLLLCSKFLLASFKLLLQGNLDNLGSWLKIL